MPFIATGKFSGYRVSRKLLGGMQTQSEINAMLIEQSIYTVVHYAIVAVGIWFIVKLAVKSALKSRDKESR